MLPQSGPKTPILTIKTQGSGTASASPVSTVPGTVITLTAVPDSGYAFKEWQVVSGFSVTPSPNNTSPIATIYMPGISTTIMAVFEPGHTHAWGSWFITIPYTVTDDGEETRSCSCGDTETRIVPKGTVRNASDWSAAITAIASGGNSKSYTINVTEDFSFPGISYPSSTFGNVTGLNVIINGDKTISLETGSTGFLLDVLPNQTVTINDLDLVGHYSNDTSRL